MAFKFSPGHCSPTCNCGANCASCPSCPGVNLCKNLSVSWTNVLAGGGSAGLADLGGCTWDSGCVTSTMRIGLDMSGATPVLTLSIYPGTCPGGTPTVCTIPADTVRCSPLAVGWTITNANCPAAYSRGFRTFTVTL